jgi:hypothetical protein
MAFGSPASKGLYFADFLIFEGASSMLFQKSVVRDTEFNIYVFILRSSKNKKMFIMSFSFNMILSLDSV